MNERLTSHLFMAPYLHHGLPVTALPIRQLHFFIFFSFVLWFWTLMWSSPSLSALSWAELVLIFDISWCRFLIRLPGCRSHTHVPVNRTIFMLCFFCLPLFVFPIVLFLPSIAISFFVKLNLFVNTFSDTCVTLSHCECEFLSAAFIISWSLKTPSNERAARLAHAKKSLFNFFF